MYKAYLSCAEMLLRLCQQNLKPRRTQDECLPETTNERNLLSVVLNPLAMFDISPANDYILNGTISFALDKDNTKALQLSTNDRFWS